MSAWFNCSIKGIDVGTALRGLGWQIYEALLSVIEEYEESEDDKEGESEGIL